MRDLEYNQYNEYNASAPEQAPTLNEIQETCDEYSASPEQHSYAEIGQDDKTAVHQKKEQKLRQKPPIGRMAMQFLAVTTAAITVTTASAAISSGKYLPKLGDFARETIQQISSMPPIANRQAAINPQLAMMMWQGETTVPATNELTMEAPAEKPISDTAEPAKETSAQNEELQSIAPAEPIAQIAILSIEPVAQQEQMAENKPINPKAKQRSNPKPKTKREPPKPIAPPVSPQVPAVTPPIVPQPPIDPIAPPVEPVVPPVEPVVPPVEPIVPPTEPTEPPIEPEVPPPEPEPEPEPDPHYHSYTEAITTAATCEADGIKTFTCAGCGNSYTEPIAATGHSITDTITPATCTVKGFTTHKCANCAYSLKDTETPLAAHSYSAWADDGDGANHSHTCSACTAKETAAHSPWIGAGDICTACAAVKQAPTPPTNAPIVAIGEITSDGTTITVNTTRTWEKGADLGVMTYRLDVLDSANAIVYTQDLANDAITLTEANNLVGGAAYTLRVTPVYTISGMAQDNSATAELAIKPVFGTLLVNITNGHLGYGTTGTIRNVTSTPSTKLEQQRNDSGTWMKVGGATPAVAVETGKTYRWKAYGVYEGIKYVIAGQEITAP